MVLLGLLVMQGSEIEELLNGVHIPNFRGVFSVKNIPNLNEGEFVIFNLSAEPPGTHWAYLTLRSVDDGGCKHYEIMDSLGIDSGYIFQNLTQKNSFYIHNIQAVQPKVSNKCGLYCCYFAIIKSENEDYDFYDLMQYCFSRNIDKNDKRVMQFMSMYQKN